MSDAFDLLAADAASVTHVFAALPVPALLADASNERLVGANDAACEFFRRTRDELLQFTIDEVIAPPNSNLHRGRGSRVGDDGVSVENRYLRGDGTAVHATAHSIRLPTDQRMSLVVLFETEAHHELIASENRYRSLVDPSPDAVSRISPSGILLDANPTVYRQTGLTDIIGKPIGELMRTERAEMIVSQVEDVVATGRQAVVWREWMQPENQGPGWFVFRFAPEFDEQTGEVIAVHLVVSEITELVENEQRLESLALVDPLTGIANRAAVFDRVQHAFDRLKRSGGGVAIAICDLDHFKAINDTFGHALGDDALCAAAQALQTDVRPHDTVGRLGGDEFVVVFEDVSDHHAAAELGERVRDAVGKCRIPRGDGRDLALSGSVGVAWTPSPTEVNDLVSRADRAMYEAKRRGRGRAWIAAETGGLDHRSDAAMRRELQAALDLEQFELRYQPIVDVTTGEIVAVEALLRWRRNGELVGPNVFMHELMASGRIGPVGRWALRTGLRQLGEWHDDPRTARLGLHLNVSPAELTWADFASVLGETMRTASVDPTSVTVEVTEQALSNVMVTRSTVREVAATGTRIALDDFGTGVSSLAHLRSRPLHAIKIDRSFVAGAEGDEVDAQIALATIGLAKALDLDVVAEGVETEAQAQWLVDLGCTMHQGWRCAPALPPDEITELCSLGGRPEYRIEPTPGGRPD